jgi:hypothetical protein
MPRPSVLTLGAALLVVLAFDFSGCGSSYSGTNLTGIDIAPISPSIAVGAQQQFTATGHFSDGSSSDLTKQANWSSSATSVATIQNVGVNPGLATGVSAGQTNITVSFAQGSSSVNASTNLTVTKTAGAHSLVEGTGTVLLHGSGMVAIDGKFMSASNVTSIALPAGKHVIHSRNGRQTLALVLSDGETVSVEVSDFGIVRK